MYFLQFPFFTLGWIETHHPGPPAATVWRSPRTSACRARESTREDSVTGQPTSSPDSSQECPGATRQSSNYPAAGAAATAENPDRTTASIVTAAAPAATLIPAGNAFLCAAGSDNGTGTEPRTKTFSTTQGGTSATGETYMVREENRPQSLASTLSNHSLVRVGASLDSYLWTEM